MNLQDIIAMAREAGMRPNMTEALISELVHFAALVAAAEREACAKVCEELKYTGFRYVPEAPKLAARIRARGEK